MCLLCLLGICHPAWPLHLPVAASCYALDPRSGNIPPSSQSQSTASPNQPMSSNTLRLLRLAHRVQLLLSVLATLLCCMLKVLPARLQRAINNHLLRGGQQQQHQAGLGLGVGRGMVSTRRQRSSAEGMQQVLDRLHSIGSQQQQQQHQPVSSKLAAVLVALFEAEDGAVRVWLTQRAQHLNSHQGDCGGDSGSPVPSCLLDDVCKEGSDTPQPTTTTHAARARAGEVCLPGGKRDATDPDDAFTAKREAEEEMGLQPGSVQVQATSF